MKKKRPLIKVRILASFFVALALLQSTLLFFSPTASAKTYSEMNIPERAKSWWYYQAVSRCVAMDAVSWNFANVSNEMSPEDAQKGNWFVKFRLGVDMGMTKVFGYFMRDTVTDIGDDGITQCYTNEGQVIKQALDLWGINPIDMLCQTDVLKRHDNQPCVSGTNNFNAGNGFNARQSRIMSYINDKVYGGSAPGNLEGANRYYYLLQSFKNICVYGNRNNGSILNAPQQSGGSWNYIIGEYISGEMKYVSYTGDKQKTASVFVWPGGSENTCGWLEDELRADKPLAAAYASAVRNDPDLAPVASDTPGGSGSAVSSCVIEGIGWIVCPVATFIAKVTDGAYGLAEQLLIFTIDDNPLQLDNPVYTVWSNIRNLANIAFILAFFMIIFSQATSVGIGSYGVKKMLPRLIVAAILVNLSYFLCVLAIDISNILGAGLDGLISSIPLADTGLGDATWEKVVAAILTGSGTVGAIVLASGASTAGFWALVASALPFLVTALFAIITALVILVARQAILILLIVVSPLAFVAYILPNTESLFTKWRKVFTTLLVFYPFVALIFAGGKMAASILRITQPDNTFLVIASLAVQVLPLFALPFILRFSGGVLGRIGGMINNPNKGPFDRLRKRAEGYADYKRKSGTANKLRSKKIAREGVFRRKKIGPDGKPYMVEKQGRMSALYSATARRQQTRDRIYAGAEQSLKEAQSEFSADKFQSDYGAALKAAAGDTDRVTQVQAYALAEKKKILGERIAAHASIIKDSQVYAQGSTYADASGKALKDKEEAYQKLFLGERVNITDGAGRVKSLQLGSDPYATEAFLDGIAKQGLSGDIRKLRAHVMGRLATNRNDDFAKMQLEAISDVIQDNFPSLGTKAPDFYKGNVAFTKSNGAAVAGWKPDTGEVALKLLQQTQGQFVQSYTLEHGVGPSDDQIRQFLSDQKSARTSLQSSLLTISNSPDLLGAVDPDMFRNLASELGVSIPSQLNKRSNGGTANTGGSSTGGSTPPPPSGSPTGPATPPGPSPAGSSPSRPSAPNSTSTPATTPTGNTTVNTVSYVNYYSQDDLRSFGKPGVTSIIASAGGVGRLSDEDLAKIGDATRDQSGLEDIFQRIHEERSRRQASARRASQASPVDPFAATTPTSTTDELGRQTPGSVEDNDRYHDGMQQ